jgi:hypothetical protein
MKIKKSIVKIFLVLLVSISCLSACSYPVAEQSMLNGTATGFKQIVQRDLDQLDADAESAAEALGKTGLSGSEARQILDNLYRKNDYVVDCCATDASGKMVTIMPEIYSRYEGSDISGQEVTIEYNQTKKPMLSKVFTAVEGFDAVVLIWPVVSDKSEDIGSLSVLFKPETLFNKAANTILSGNKIEIEVIQVDGLTLYDSSDEDTGTNLFTDPRFQPYTELISLGHKIAGQESGSGSYSYKSNENSQLVKKDAYWVSAGLHGTSWRIVAIIEAVD